jgi:hypothetical protein
MMPHQADYGLKIPRCSGGLKALDRRGGGPHLVFVREQPTRCFGRRLTQRCGAWNYQRFRERPGWHVPRMMTWTSGTHALPRCALVEN